MKLTKDQIEHIAKLARIALSEEEKEKFTIQLTQVLEYMDVLNEVDTTNVYETSQVTGLSNIFRTDTVIPANDGTRQKILENFPKRVGNLLEVPPVF